MFDLSEPIIQHRTDTDFYKKTMQQFIWHRYPDVEVTFVFKNRTKDVKLGKIIEEKLMREELDYAWGLLHTPNEIGFLAGLKNENGPIFKEDYLKFLETARTPAYELKWGDDFELSCKGPWALVTDAEIFPMSITTELYGRALLAKAGLSEAEAWQVAETKLLGKIGLLKENPFALFSDFATRRRFSHKRHEDIILTTANELPKQFLGTSNVYFAMKHGLAPIGTMAHELFMVAAGLADSDEDIRNSQNRIIEEWYEEYGYPLSVALVDTYGSDAFYKFVPKEMGLKYKGVRPDSGDPIAEGEKVIEWFRNCGADPREKFHVPSDGLTVETLIRYAKHFNGRIKTIAGWGTSFANDFGFKNVSIVMKALEANGRGLVKLSNNIAKAMGTPKNIEKQKKTWGYTTIFDKPCVY